MRDNYDFSKGHRGKFYRPNEKYNININYESLKDPAKFEIFKKKDQLFYFRLKSNAGVVMYESKGYPSKKECLFGVQDYQTLIMSAIIVNV